MDNRAVPELDRHIFLGIHRHRFGGGVETLIAIRPTERGMLLTTRTGSGGLRQPVFKGLVVE